MKRPTCKTCVHFVGGECWKEPPSPVVVDDLSGGTMARPWIPPVHESYGCSHHPDFPAYVASLKPIRKKRTTTCEHCGETVPLVLDRKFDRHRRECKGLAALRAAKTVIPPDSPA